MLHLVFDTVRLCENNLTCFGLLVKQGHYERGFFTMSIISEKFNSKIDFLKNQFKLNKEVRHQGVKGGLNENELMHLIKECIPKKYRTARGVIEDHQGRQSNEADIIIYDEDIIPSFATLALDFVPVEAVKYVFEVKSKLNSKELKTTIAKFRKFKEIGGSSPAVLFSFSSDIKKSELTRYKKNDSHFFTDPAITVLCVSSKCYYFKETEEYFIKDALPVKDFLAKMAPDLEGPQHAISELMKNNEALSQLSRSAFALLIMGLIQSNEFFKKMPDYELNVNGLNYAGIKYKVHRWIGVECDDNNIELMFFSGVSNTLSKGSFGKYLLNGKEVKSKCFSVCYEDMWGNLSCQDFNEHGLDYDMDRVFFELKIGGEGNEGNKILFKIER